MSLLIGFAWALGMATLFGAFATTLLHRGLRVPVGAGLLAWVSLLAGGMTTLAMLSLFFVSGEANDEAHLQALLVVFIFTVMCSGLASPTCFLLGRRYRHRAGGNPGGDETAVFE